MLCPYCQVEMKPGCIEADGRQSVVWVEENKKRNFYTRLMERECLVLAETELVGRCEVFSYYCEGCDKIIIDRKEL